MAFPNCLPEVKCCKIPAAANLFKGLERVSIEGLFVKAATVSPSTVCKTTKLSCDRNVIILPNSEINWSRKNTHHNGCDITLASARRKIQLNQNSCGLTK